ncbi:MAG: UDP-N-acetylmuramoyl-L-alanyl-D-glutamate--2,6-diaminopimelate ligase [Bacilli bacterium]
MLLKDIFEPIVLKTVHGSQDIEISAVSDDSRRVETGSLFVAYRGAHVDGHSFVQAAVAAGAAAVLVEELCDVPCPQVVVPSVRRVAPYVAHAVAGFPARAMTMVGVTGTNGKTTTTTLIEQILQAYGKTTGLIGTIEQRTNRGELRGSQMTTPEAAELARVLREMRELDTEYVVMEVSSHALSQARAAGVPYRIAAFTNLTQDHLDFHGGMEEYGQAKGKLFSRLGNDFLSSADGFLPVAVLNADDPWSAAYAGDTVQQVVTYGLAQSADVRAADVSITADGASFQLRSFAGDAPVRLQMTGRFSVYNALCAAASTLALGVPLSVIKTALESVAGVPGRFERVFAGQPYTILVDYSHTPDSLENALTTIREFCAGRVLTVVGCGGDRDRKKRPLMAQTALKYSDFTVLTSDNPRTEDPDGILDDMEAGIADAPRQAYTRETLRAEGIRAVLARARADDVVLIAGKGHETYQIIGAAKHDFDDRVVATEIVRGQR